jgi:hypothetical protein
MIGERDNYLEKPMPENAGWVQVHTEKPVDGYSSLTLRMKIDGGYLYNVIIMDFGGWGRAKFSNSVTFVPDRS